MSVILKLTRIVQAAAEAESPVAQVRVIVDSIRGAMDIDACNLYLANASDEMVLVASHGLGEAAIGKARLPPGTGLVGLAARTRHPVNVADAASHPAFHYVPGTREERFRSFCGVPLVRAGRVIGVLVTQSRKRRQLSEEEEAFLVTLGTQLALVVATGDDWQQLDASATRTLTGIRGAPGIALGAACLCEDADLYAVTDMPCSDIERALFEWRELVSAVQEDVRLEQRSLGAELGREVSAVFDAYQMLLADPALTGAVEHAIREGHHLPAALKQVIQHFAELFLAMDDPYLRARHEDIHHLGNKLYGAWRGMRGSTAERPPPGPKVLVGSQVSVSDIALMPQDELVGIVCFQGSSLSHTAVLANALGIPAVVGVRELKGVYNGEPLIVDGFAGEVILQPNASVRREYRRLAAEEKQLRGQLQGLRDKPALTPDGVTVSLYANSGLLADISPGLASGAEGLGLYRTEIPFMVSETFPSEDEQCHIYRQVLEAYRGKSVYMRVLDIGGDKPLPYFPIREENPALGWRGIRFCLDNISLLMTQLRAMLRAASGIGNLRILVPMVANTAELSSFHAILADACSQLVEEGVDVVKPPVGIMVEVPAAISQLPLWRAQLDFISIGSNDLSQYLLALDRNNPRVSAAYDHIHPAVLREIARIVESAEGLELPLSLCGEMSSDPAAVVLLLGMGIRSLSMSAAQLPRIKWLVRSIRAEDARYLSRQALAMGDGDAIRAMVNEKLRELGLASLVH